MIISREDESITDFIVFEVIENPKAIGVIPIPGVLQGRIRI